MLDYRRCPGFHDNNIHYLFSVSPKFPDLTALPLSSHLPLITRSPDPFLLLCRQYNSFRSCLLNEMGKHTHTHTHFGGVCGERNSSRISGSRDASGRYVFSIYSHTVQPPGTFCTEMCPVCPFDGVWVTLTV